MMGMMHWVVAVVCLHHAAALRVNHQHSLTGSMHREDPTMAVVVRTYHGDEYMLERLLDNLRMFMLPQIERIIVLDDESREDHLLGDKLKGRYNVTVKYERLPSFKLRPSGEGMKRAQTVGYQRQMWSSFYLDNYTDADVIAQVDSDAQMFTLMSPDVEFDDSGKLLVRAMNGDHWPGDTTAWNRVSVPRIDAMWLDRMPMFFWRKTFPEFREFMRKTWKARSFDESFQQWSPTCYSWQNLVFQFGALFQKQDYALRLSSQFPPVASIGTNKLDGVRSIQAGCCRSFELQNKQCTSSLQKDYEHMLAYNNIRPIWLNGIDRKTPADFVDRHYEKVHALVKDGKYEKEFRAMRDMCKDYLDHPQNQWMPRAFKVRETVEGEDDYVDPREIVISYARVREASGSQDDAMNPFESTISDATCGKPYEMKKIRTYEGSPPDVAWAREHPRARDEADPCVSSQWAVVTTIFQVSESIRLLDESRFCIAVVADLKSVPTLADYLPESKRVRYLTPDDQRKLGFRSVEVIPWNSFSRKNLGFLYAMQQGARIILDLDDDNKLLDLGAMVSEESGEVTGRMLPQGAGCINPYNWFAPTSASWPRGAPLNCAKDGNATPPSRAVVDLGSVAVRQHLAQLNPDVDAIYRLTQPLPLAFDPKQLPLVLPAGTWAPFNAQATTWAHSGFPFMMLPHTVHGRVADIWRSYIAQPLLWQQNQTMMFSGAEATVEDRNQHNLDGDFTAELPLYTEAQAMTEFLVSHSAEFLKQRGGRGVDSHEALFDAYVQLYEHGILESDDVEAVKAWIEDLVSLKVM